VPNYGVYFNLNENPKSLENSAKKAEKKNTLNPIEGRSPRKEYDPTEQEYLDHPKSKKSPRKVNSPRKENYWNK
jgi:hypothetical protein